MNIKKLAHNKGHDVQGRLKRISDDKFLDERENHRVLKRYTDEQGTVYAINERGEIAYIAGEDWIM